MFIKRSALASAGIGLAATMPMAVNSCMGANEKLVCALIGSKGMGFADLKAFLRQPNTECAAICDVDNNVLTQELLMLKRSRGKDLKDSEILESYWKSRGLM